MVRSNPNNDSRFHAYFQRPLADRQQLRNHVHPQFRQRQNWYKKRQIHPERGLAIDEIDNPRVVEIAIQRGWTDYTRQPEPYDPLLVIEFYAAMISGTFNEFHTVKVRGRVVTMSPEDICLHYQVHRPDHLGMTFGISPIPNVGPNETHSPIIASSLRRNRNGVWRPRTAEILKSQMTADLGMWLLFLKTSLIPSTHTTTVDSFVARIMYCVQHNLPLDIGHIIQLQMIDAASETNSTGILPFPCLITKFCRDAGIPVGTTCKSKPAYGNTALRKQLLAMQNWDLKERAQHEEMQVPEEVDEEEAEDDYDPVEEEMPSDIAGLTRHFNEQILGIRTEMREGFREARDEMRGYYHDIMEAVSGRRGATGAGPSRQPESGPQDPHSGTSYTRRRRTREE